MNTINKYSIKRSRFSAPTLLLSLSASLLLSTFFTGCRSSGVAKITEEPQSLTVHHLSESVENTGGNAAPRSDEIAPDKSENPQLAARKSMKIITGDIFLDTRDIKKATRELSRAVASAGGEISGTETSMAGPENGESTAVVTVRLPATGAEPALEKIRAIGTVTSENIKTDDVTREFIDLQARLANLTREEQTLQGIMAKASAVSDVLEVERELSRVRGDIESFTGQINLMKDQVAMATITVHITERIPVKIGKWSLGQTFSDAWHALVATSQAIVRGLVWALVFIPIIVPAWFILRYVRNSRRKRKAAAIKE